MFLMSRSCFPWNTVIIYCTMCPGIFKKKRERARGFAGLLVSASSFWVWKLYCSLSTGLWWSDRWFIGSQTLCFSGEHFYPFVLQPAQSLVTAEATNEGNCLLKNPRTIIHICPHFRSQSIPVWFNSLLLLKKSICLIELLGSKVWMNSMHFNHSY